MSQNSIIHASPPVSPEARAMMIELAVLQRLAAPVQRSLDAIGTAEQKAWDRTPARKNETKKEGAAEVAYLQKAVPLRDPNRGIAKQFSLVTDIVMALYTPQWNEALTLLPSEITVDAVVHDLGALTFAVTLPKGVGDRELEKWGQTSLILATTKGPVREPLANLIWLVTKKIEWAINLMRDHMMSVKFELLKEAQKYLEDDDVIEPYRKKLHHHGLLAEVLSDDFTDLRLKLRTRFGDATVGFKEKHKFELLPTQSYGNEWSSQDSLDRASREEMKKFEAEVDEAYKLLKTVLEEAKMESEVLPSRYTHDNSDDERATRSKNNAKAGKSQSSRSHKARN